MVSVQPAALTLRLTEARTVLEVKKAWFPLPTCKPIGAISTFDAVEGRTRCDWFQIVLTVPLMLPAGVASVTSILSV